MKEPHLSLLEGMFVAGTIAVVGSYTNMDYIVRGAGLVSNTVMQGLERGSMLKQESKVRIYIGQEPVDIPDYEFARKEGSLPDLVARND